MPEWVKLALDEPTEFGDELDPDEERLAKLALEDFLKHAAEEEQQSTDFN